MPTLRLLHFSDLHGTSMREAGSLIEGFKPDWIVLTGDMLPDFARLPNRSRRMQAQTEWWGSWRSEFLLEGATTTFTLGNHEVEGFEDRNLRQVPSLLRGRVAMVEGIPARWGAWGFAREWDDDELEEEVLALGRDGDPLVILSHVPPYGWLDRNNRGERIGHIPLRNFLDPTEEQLERHGNSLPQRPASLVLCGHVHESFGWERHGPTVVVNAATGYALLNFDTDSGSVEIIQMERLLRDRPDPYN